MSHYEKVTQEEHTSDALGITATPCINLILLE